MGYIPYHPAYDKEKLHQFVSILQQAVDEGRPWPFPPLVVAGEFLLTGSHRYAAAEEVSWEREGLSIDVVQLVDLFEAAGLDFDTLHTQHNSPTIDDSDDLIALLGELPDEFRREYGIDLH